MIYKNGNWKTMIIKTAIQEIIPLAIELIFNLFRKKKKPKLKLVKNKG